MPEKYLENSAYIVGQYRYRLTRAWAKEKDKPNGVLWIMLNPSTADGDYDDNTIRKCVTLSKNWGMGRLGVVNLFAYRSTSPDHLAAQAAAGVDVVGPKNREVILDACQNFSGRGDYIVCAWGDNALRKPLRDGRDAAVSLLPVADLLTIKTTNSGEPGHPLYVPNTSVVVPWEMKFCQTS